MTATDGVFRLDRLVEYQEGAIVSRKLAVAGGGNISVFAFAAGEALSEHTTPHTALLQVLEGRTEVRIDQRSFSLDSGESILLPPGVPHAVSAPEPCKLSLTMLRSRT